MEKIKQVIDTYFDFMEELGGNSDLREIVPISMIDTSKISEEDWVYWNAIESTVSDKEINQLEEFFGHKLPSDYVFFLKYRHFVELDLGTNDIGFFRNIPNQILIFIKEEVGAYYGEILERNFIPFANLSDYGVVCFDANEFGDNGNYPIVVFDHDEGYEVPEWHAENFGSMFVEFEEHLNEWIVNYRADNDS